MSAPARQTIGLLGGSFNPAHAGHREISLAAIDGLGLDSVWWLVSPGNPLKDPAIYAPYPERLAVARRVAAHPRIVVSNFEERRGLTFTIDTVRTMTDLWPQIGFVWLMGADSLGAFHRWRDWRSLAELIPLAVFARPGAEAALESEAARELAPFRLPESNASGLIAADPPVWVYITSTANPASSTAIRSQPDGDGAH